MIPIITNAKPIKSSIFYLLFIIKGYDLFELSPKPSQTPESEPDPRRALPWRGVDHLDKSR